MIILGSPCLSRRRADIRYLAWRTPPPRPAQLSPAKQAGRRSPALGWPAVPAPAQPSQPGRTSPCPGWPPVPALGLAVGSSMAGMAFRLMDVAAVFAGAYQSLIHQAERSPHAPSAPQAPRASRAARIRHRSSIRRHSAARHNDSAVPVMLFSRVDDQLLEGWPARDR